MPIEFSFRATGSRFPTSGRHPIRQTDLATGKVAPFAEYLESHEVLAGFDSRTTLLAGYGTVALSLIVVEEVTGGDGTDVPSVINSVDTGRHGTQDNRPIDSDRIPVSPSITKAFSRRPALAPGDPESCASFADGAMVPMSSSRSTRTASRS